MSAGARKYAVTICAKHGNKHFKGTNKEHIHVVVPIPNTKAKRRHGGCPSCKS